MRRPDQSLEEALGRALSPADRGSVDTLNDLPDELVREARGLTRTSRLAATAYLQYYVKKADTVDGFIADVLEHGSVAASEWGKRDVICFPNPKPAHWIRLEAVDLVAPLADIEGERWLRVAPAAEPWDWSGVAGAPGVFVRLAPYWFDPPHGIEYGDIDSEALERVPAADFEIAARRWMASRVAWELRGREPADCRTLEAVCAGLGVDPGRLSVTAQAAIRGLLRSGWPQVGGSTVPGFDGQDDLYR